jgi:hypothetical protein
VIARFDALLDWIDTQIPVLELDVVAIGNEVDATLATDAARWTQWQNFFVATSTHARSLWPGVPVGCKATFRGLLGAPGPFLQTLNRQADVVCATYYPLHADFTVRPP